MGSIVFRNRYWFYKSLYDDYLGRDFKLALGLSMVLWMPHYWVGISVNRCVEEFASHKHYMMEWGPRRNRLTHSLIFEEFEMVVEDWVNLQRQWELSTTQSTQMEEHYLHNDARDSQTIPKYIFTNKSPNSYLSPLALLSPFQPFPSYLHPSKKLIRNISSFSGVVMTSFLRMSLPRREVEAVLKGFRNGVEYGSKVRFVHTLVMTLLFKDIHLKRLPALLKAILAMALEHGRNLGLFVLAYKTGYKTLNYLWGMRALNHFLSGLLFGTLIFGKKTGVNNQIVLYLFSRVIIGLATMAYRYLSKVSFGKCFLVEKGYTYYLMAAVCWGTVMWLFEKDKNLLQTSLSHSMEFLYKESDTVQQLTDLIPYYPKTNKKAAKISKSTTKSSSK